MALLSDYFLLYHGVNFHPDEEENTLASWQNTEEEFQLFALFLMITRKEFEKFLALDAFVILCKKLHSETVKDLSTLHKLQYTILHTITENDTLENSKILNQAFSTLRDETLLSKENYKKLISLFEYTQVQEVEEKAQQKEKNFSFREAKKSLSEIMDLLKDEIDDKSSLTEIKTFLEDQKFSIGISGVMNAGKSTMINALMGKAILGTSVVPETANLTVLKYDKAEQAFVFYWNRQEWDNIVKASQTLDAMKNFVEESQAVFESDLDLYIQKKSRVDQVPVHELSKYTSVKKSDKKCNLIKVVEVKTPLSFLQNGVEIVDTPGLDDPVIQREEITKAYISRCDMLLHLMNVSQSATQKDIEFILDALLYQNVSKLLIVISRADTVEKKELDEVIAYTKQAIEKELKLQNRGSKLDAILESIRFIALSGKLALECKMAKEKGIEPSYELEETGLPKLERYLEENLFGSNAQKSQLIIRSSQNKLLKVIEKQKNIWEYALEIASNTQEELKERIVLFETKKQNSEKHISGMNEVLLLTKRELHTHMRSLENFLASEFYNLKNILVQRVVSDVRYTYETTKRIPELSRTTVIVQTALKDGIIDIVRDYKYKLSQKFEAVNEEYEMKYKSLHFPENLLFNTEIFFADSFKSGFLTRNNEVLIQHILDAVSQSKAKEIPALEKNISSRVKDELLTIEEDIKVKIKPLTYEYIDIFMETIKRPNTLMKEQVLSEELSLKKQLEVLTNSTGNSAYRAINIHQKIKKLTAFEQEIKGSFYV